MAQSPENMKKKSEGARAGLKLKEGGEKETNTPERYAPWHYIIIMFVAQCHYREFSSDVVNNKTLVPTIVVYTTHD